MYPILETERLLLKPLQDNDIDDMYGLYSNPDVAATMEYHDAIIGFPKYQKEFPKMVMCGDYLTIRDKETERFIGFILLHQYIKQNKVSYSQMATALLPEYWGKGYCTEATKKLLRFAFINVKTPWICGNQFQDNPAAETVLKRCGLKFYKTYKMRNRLYDQYRYTKADYMSDNGMETESETDAYDYKLPDVPKSLYNYKKPIRKIDSITFIEQPTEYLCGQAVIAMLADVSVDEVISVMENDKGTSTQELRNALKWYGLKTATNARLKYTEDIKLPDCCILSIMLPDYGHWSLYYKGKYYDPEFGVLDKLPEQAKLRYYWEVVI